MPLQCLKYNNNTTNAAVVINGEITRSIKNGLVILIGIETTDTVEDVEWLCAKIPKLRVFNDADGVMNLSLNEINGDIMLVSQFTLHALTKKGNRPSYIKAARPEQAIPLYEEFIKQLSKESDREIVTGEFGADMKITLTNDGPVTIIIDSKNKE